MHRRNGGSPRSSSLRTYLPHRAGTPTDGLWAFFITRVYGEFLYYGKRIVPWETHGYHSWCLLPAATSLDAIDSRAGWWGNSGHIYILIIYKHHRFTEETNFLVSLADVISIRDRMLLPNICNLLRHIHLYTP